MMLAAAIGLETLLPGLRPGLHEAETPTLGAFERSGMKIAGRETHANWGVLKARLQSAPTSQLWASAFHRFYRARIETRYLTPIALIEKDGAHLGEGFAIVALFCTLVEYLESVERGDNFRFVGSTKVALGSHEYSERQAKTYFKDFLRTRAPFNSLVPASLIDSFYQDVRCGLLHEAQTKGGWIISANGPKGRLVTQQGGAIKLFRNQLVPAVETYVTDYKQRLLTDPNTQAAFIRKFDHLCVP